MLKLNLQFFGGRGSSSGGSKKSAGGGGGTFDAQQSSANLQTLLQEAAGKNGKTRKMNSAFYKKGTYDGGGNAGLQKYQGQTDDKTGSFLSKVRKSNVLTDPNNQDNYGGYHDNPFQQLSLSLGLNNKPTALNQQDFDAYCKATGQTPSYRGWSGKASRERFENSAFTHHGTGIYGDGLYFGSGASGKAIAQSYGGEVSTIALSPSARVVKLSEVRKAINAASPKLRKSLGMAGSQGSRSYGNNMGEAQMALKMGYNVIKVDTGGGGYNYAITRDALVYLKQ